ncbi:MAG: LacI family transcriptional regulator [Defluviitaleaceae bacterium]|nr:LacI family transcriptional regulator [Defluviitaleaceae bacterium]MCL2835743.1 LacI family transcriptional regulator [Defluviitaleaceae bacterium]
MTIREIAEIAGVSTATVSYVLNNTKNVTQEKRRRVLDAVAQSGYQTNNIAKSLRVKRTENIGVLVEDIRGFPVPSIINGISEYAGQNGYRILLNDLRMLESLFNQYDQIKLHKDRINEAISLLLHGAVVDAVIYIGMFDRDITGIINEIRKPLVIAYSTADDGHAHSVTYDSNNITHDAIRYLFNRGHRRVAVITGSQDTFPTRMRMQGVYRAFDAMGLAPDNSLIKNGDWEYQSGYSGAVELLEQANPPTAIFAMNDLMASGAMDAIRDAGFSVPGDISVIGFDNREIAYYLRPKLTTIEIDLKGIGLAAAKMAIDAIKGKTTETERMVIIPSKLILRDTVQDIKNMRGE